MKAKIIRMNEGVSVYPLYEVVDGLTVRDVRPILNGLNIVHPAGKIIYREFYNHEKPYQEHTASWMITNQDEYEKQRCFCMICNERMDIEEARRLIKENNK